MKTAPWLLTIALAAPLAGCITVDVGGKKDTAAPADVFHVLEPAVAAEAGSLGAKEPQASDTVIAVRSFRAAGRFDKHVVRRDGAGVVSGLDHDYWADEPAAAVTDAVRETLAAAAGAAAVVDPVNAITAHVVLDGVIQEFTFVPGTPSKALVRIRFTWADARTWRVVQSGIQEASVELPGAGTDGLGVAMARAVGRATVAALAARGSAAPPPRADDAR